jgi:hypothetical protein
MHEVGATEIKIRVQSVLATTCELIVCPYADWLERGMYEVMIKDYGSRAHGVLYPPEALWVFIICTNHLLKVPSSISSQRIFMCFTRFAA